MSIDTKYLSDWSGLRRGVPAEVLFPKSTQEVSDIVKECQLAKRPITIQGGLTGLTGGAVPADGDTVINFEKMNRIEHIDTLEGIMIVEAGATLIEVQEAAKQAGWFFPVDLGARGSCQIGGNAATNAGGERVLKYGTVRDSILGLEVVLADGSVLDSMTQLVKNSSGLDLRYLFIGSEGTLGIITRLVLKLQPAPGPTTSALLAIDDFDQVPNALRQLKQSLGSTLSAYEFMSKAFIDMTCSLIKAPVPFTPNPQWTILIEAEGSQHQDVQVLVEQALQELLESKIINNAIIAKNENDRLGFWKLRQSIPEIFSHLKPTINFDVGLPLKHVSRCIQTLEHGLHQLNPKASHLFFGHLGDNNVHLITGPHAIADRHAIEQFVYEELASYGGTISAEHGIGFIKKPFIELSRNAEQLKLIKQLKQAMDPHNLLNPNRIV